MSKVTIKQLEVKHLHSLSLQLTTTTKNSGMWRQNHLATLEKYNCIEKLQAKAIYSQFLHIFSLYVHQFSLFVMEKISLAGKVEAILYSLEIQTPGWYCQGTKYSRVFPKWIAVRQIFPLVSSNPKRRFRNFQAANQGH